MSEKQTSNIFIQRPKLAIVISLVIMLAGILMIKMLPLEEYPSITPPQVVVTATYAGESATITVDVPSLLAGQVATMSPTIVLQKKSEVINAKAEIRPIVLYLTNNVVLDVTALSDCEIEYDPASVFEGTPSLEGTTSKVTATYKGISSTVSVNVPALAAGQYVTLTPTLLLVAEEEEEEPGGEDDPSFIKLKEAKDLAAQVKIAGRDIYQMNRTFGVLDKAAANEGEGGSMIGMGIGLGAGVGVGNQMGAMATQAMVVGSIPPPLPQTSMYYIAINGQQQGPFDTNTVIGLIQNQQINMETLVWKQGMPSWSKISALSEFASLFSLTPPPIPSNP